MKAIYLKQIPLVAMALAASSSNVKAQRLYIGTGSNLVAKGPVSIVLQDAGLSNDGICTTDSSTFLFSGNTVTSPLLSGNNPVGFYNLTINKPGGELMANQTLSVAGALAMQNGHLLLNNDANVNLVGAGQITGENEQSNIIANSGSAVIVKPNLVAPQALNPGNIGLELTSNATLGPTTISRLDNPQMTASGAVSIKRYFVVFTNNYHGWDATIKMYYLDTLLNGNAAANLTVWLPSDATSQWIPSGKDSNSLTGKWVALGHIDHFVQLTLGGNGATPAAMSIDTAASVQPQLFPNPAHDQFTLSVTSPGEKDDLIGLYDQDGHLLQEKPVHLATGPNNITWNIGAYTTGIYTLQSATNSFKSIRFIRK